MQHYGYDADRGCASGLPTGEDEQTAIELGDRVMLAYEHERDNRSWPA